MAESVQNVFAAHTEFVTLGLWQTVVPKGLLLTQWSMVGWVAAPAGRFDYFVSIRGWANDHECSGILINGSWVLTAAHCMESVGPNPIVHVTALEAGGAGPAAGAELRVVDSIPHPKWNGKLNGGWDAALLELHRSVDVVGPCPAAPTFDAYPSMQLLVLGFHDRLRMAKMTVVKNSLCPGLQGLVSNMMCTVSDFAPLEKGNSGGPALIVYTPTGPNDLANMQMGSPELDLLVGVVSHSNLGHGQGRGTAHARIMDIRPWIFDVVYPKDVHRHGHDDKVCHQQQSNIGDVSKVFSYLLMLVIVVAVVMAVKSTHPLHWSWYLGTVSSPQIWSSKQMVGSSQRAVAELLAAGRVPSTPAHYVPRPDLALPAQNYLTCDQLPGGRKRVSVEGMTGFGKTALVVEIVRSGNVMEHFQDGILWMCIRLHRGNIGKPLVHLFHDMYRHVLELIERRPIANSGFSGWREQDYLVAINKVLRGKQFLLVLDGLRDKGVLDAVLKVDCTLIVTSQMREALHGVNGVCTVQVDSLTKEGSQQLLSNVAREGVNHEVAIEILELSEGHPLSLSIMGKALGDAFEKDENAKLREIEELVTLIRNTADRMHLVMEDVDLLNVEAQDRHRMLYRCFEFALDGLDEDERRCFILLVVLPKGTCALPDELHRLWGLGCMERTQERVRMLEGRYLLHRFRNGAFGLHGLQHDFLQAITSTQDRYRSMVEAERESLRAA